MKYDKQLALSFIAIAGFQVLQAWNANAPSLEQVRESVPGDGSMRQKLYDADVLVGGTAIILGGAAAIMTHDKTALIVMLTIFGSVSLWHHRVLNSEAT